MRRHALLALALWISGTLGAAQGIGSALPDVQLKGPLAFCA